MTPPWEARLTWGLTAICIVTALLNLLPRLSVRNNAVKHERPEMTVAVEGAVASPGVYRLPWGARVTDLIGRAGGLTPQAERKLINLADPLVAGEVVVVPNRTTPAGDTRIDVNSASLAQLETLPGVGPATARKIIAGRPYARLEDLLRVSGIGPKTLERLRSLITL